VKLLHRAVTARKSLPPLEGKYPVDAVHIGFDEGLRPQVAFHSLKFYGRFILTSVPICFETQPSISL